MLKFLVLRVSGVGQYGHTVGQKIWTETEHTIVYQQNALELVVVLDCSQVFHIYAFICQDTVLSVEPHLNQSVLGVNHLVDHCICILLTTRSENP